MSKRRGKKKRIFGDTRDVVETAIDLSKKSKAFTWDALIRKNRKLFRKWRL